MSPGDWIRTRAGEGRHPRTSVSGTPVSVLCQNHRDYSGTAAISALANRLILRRFDSIATDSPPSSGDLKIPVAGVQLSPCPPFFLILPHGWRHSC
jgi:hypothetical protein